MITNTTINCKTNMTLREYYAGLAMSAMLSNPEGFHLPVSSIAINAVLYADVLISELNKKKCGTDA